ncbi:uncharacterized protein ColSpa_11751 [Colletotrichum spaethianum]|uniref:Uncharacterized protein n=1 Tax=Colletotrichum spaethianum TaxID=700344 RepID=A0AA37UPZ0_9PEZI|nr:uncharacterized protein ColSpa_11751 [Colletotrichum spaethianum]GKT51570.1 uncharacterized protein ColSpa_11751 [Colletotrichum spaethianum]
MSSYYQFNHHQAHPTPAVPGASHNHHGGRNRRAPRLSVSQNQHKQFRGVRSMKELTESATINAFRTKFEAGRSFDLEDDMEFCPGLLTDSDQSGMKLHQPSATRARNAIPIVNPATGITMSSPSPSVSPARMQQGIRRW